MEAPGKSLPRATLMLSVSILMSLYEGERPDFLRQSLLSLQEQSRAADQVILVLDGPIPHALRDVIYEFRDSLPLLIVELPTNVGLASALNYGLGACTGDIILRHDTDDIAFIERVAIQAARLEDRRDIDILGALAVIIDENNVQLRTMKRPHHNRQIISTMWANPLIHPTVAIRASSMAVLGGYNPALRRSEDHDLWIRAALLGMKFENLQESLVYYRHFEKSFTKLTVKAGLERSKVAYAGSRLLHLPIYTRLLSWGPLVKSLLPLPARRIATELLRLVDPRAAR